MKNLILIAILFVAIGSGAQTQVTSKALGDKIWLQPGAYEVTPRLIGLSNDTLRSVGYSVNFGRDTASIAAISVNGYNKYGSIIITKPLNAAMSAYKKWGGLISIIDAYISTIYPTVVKQ